MQLLNKSRLGLRYMLDVTPELHRLQPLEELLQGVLLQVAGLLGAANSFIAVKPARDPEPGEAHGFVAVLEESEPVIRVGTGRFRAQDPLDACLDGDKLRRVRETVQKGAIELADDVTIVPLQVGGEVTGVVYLDRAAKDVDRELLTLLANQASVAIQNAQLYYIATVDALTGVYARRFVEQWLCRELRAALRGRRPLSLVMVDLDDFKQINDEAGHVMGDRALALVGRVLSQATRGTDLAGRYGGDEFTLVLPGTDAEGAAVLCERVLRMLREASIQGPAGPLPVRASIGYATLTAPAFGAQDMPSSVPLEYFLALGQALVAAADAAAYAAKRDGGQTFASAPPLIWPPFAAAPLPAQAPAPAAA